MDNQKLLLRAVERIYAAAAAPLEWPGSLAAVADLIGGDHAFLDLHAAGQGAFRVSARVDERHLARASSPEAMRLAAPVMGAIPVGIATRTELLPDREFARSECYNEILRPMDGFYSIHARQERAAAGFVVSICRSENSGNFGQAEAATLRTLVPHFATALDFHRRLQTAEQRHAGLAQALDRLATGVILTDAAAVPLFVNAAAAGIAAELDGLMLTARGLAAASRDATARLRGAIAAVGRADGDARFSAGHGQRLCLGRPSGRPALLVAVLPVWRLGVMLAGTRDPRAAVFITQPDRPAALDRLAVAQVFGLTPRESDVAMLLASGRDLPGAASILGIGLGTARYHLKRIFEKTDTHSQSALIALVRGFAQAVR